MGPSKPLSMLTNPLVGKDIPYMRFEADHPFMEAEPLVKSVTLDSTSALKFLHGQGIAHRDIKPSVCIHLAILFSSS